MNMNFKMPNFQNVVKDVYGKVSNIPQSQDDAVQLYKAVKGNDCDTSSVISILAHRNESQRTLIEQEYNKMYSEDLKERLSLKLNGFIKKAVLLWMPGPVKRDAIILREAFTTKIDLTVVTEVLCSKTPSEIQSLKNMYHTVYGIYLEHEIMSHTSGYFEKLLLAYISIARSDGKEIDGMTAISDAKALYAAGQKGSDDKKTFIFTFTGRSRAQLVAVSTEYQRLYGRTLKKAILSQSSGPLDQALVTILECAENTAGYFAKVLHKTGPDDATLIRVIVSRSEIDMQSIKVEYQKENGKSLRDAVDSMTSGHYRTFLNSLLGTI